MLVKPSDFTNAVFSGDFKSIMGKLEDSKKFIQNPTLSPEAVLGHQFGVDKAKSFDFYKNLFGKGDEGDDVEEWEKKSREKSEESRKKVKQALYDTYGVETDDVAAIGQKVVDSFNKNKDSEELSAFELIGTAFKFNDMFKKLGSKDPKVKKEMADKLKEVKDLELDKKLGKYFGVDVEDEESMKNRLAERQYYKDKKAKEN